MLADSDEEFMHQAIEAARHGARQSGAAPVGCVIVREGKVLARAFNEVELQGDPTAHAEIVAIRRACAAVDDVRLRGATLYSTLQPCGMCTMASIWSKLNRIVYGAGRADVHRMYFEDRHFDCADFVHDAFRDDLTVVGGVARSACAEFYPGPEVLIPATEQANL